MFYQTSTSLCCCLLISGCRRDSLTWASHWGPQIYIQPFCFQNSTLKFARPTHSYSSGMILLSQKGLFRNYVNMQICWTQDFCCCLKQFEDKQQLTVSLFYLNLFKAPGCFLWVQIWMTIQSNANHEFIHLMLFPWQCYIALLGKECFHLCITGNLEASPSKQITFFGLCFDAAWVEINIIAIWEDRKKN